MIKITRQEAWTYWFSKMQISINNEISVSLSSGETKNVKLSEKAEYITISVLVGGANQGEFTTKYSSNIKEIIVKQGFSHARCFVVLQNGIRHELIVKNAPSNITVAIYWMLLILFVLIISGLFSSSSYVDEYRWHTSYQIRDTTTFTWY